MSVIPKINIEKISTFWPDQAYFHAWFIWFLNHPFFAYVTQ